MHIYIYLQYIDRYISTYINLSSSKNKGLIEQTNYVFYQQKFGFYDHTWGFQYGISGISDIWKQQLEISADRSY